MSTNPNQLARYDEPMAAERTAKPIQGRKYVAVEGWQAIAIAHGCTASARDVEAIEGGIRAIGEVRRMSDQALISSAEGFLGDDESMWAKRPLFARRAMAQTRAISRACRSAFAHVVVMIDADLGTTPAEEMEAAVTPEKTNSKGETYTKQPNWTNEQKTEAGKIRAEIINLGGDPADKETIELRNRMKGDAPSDMIDALIALRNKWADIADQAKG